MIDALLRALFLALVVAVTVRLALLARGNLPAGYGALVMAVGIFVHAAWRTLPFAGSVATTALALVLSAIWLVLTASFASTACRGTFHAYYDDPVARLALGAWVAGTAVTGTVIAQVFPSWRLLAAALALVALLLWLWFLSVAVQGAHAILDDPLRRYVAGSVLLLTVSTQSVAILIQVVAPASLARWLCVPLIAMGCALYVCGMILIVRQYWCRQGWQLTDDWQNSNCIIHGALSITGLAAVSSGAFPLEWIVLEWLCVLLLFAVVESIELARLYARVTAYGWRRGALTYHVSQWARNFTFGMFYAFTLTLYAAGAGTRLPHPVLALQQAILRYGQYAVLTLLVVESALFLTQAQHN